jgi:DNA-binding MarR family transcriptional regulator
MSRDGGSPGVITTLARVAFLVNGAYAEAGRATGVTPQQGQLLCMLRPGPWGFGALTAALGLAKSTTSGLVDGVEARGLVHRRPGEDPRSVVVALTPAGSEVADRFYAAATTRVERDLAPVTPEALASVADLLAPVVEDRRYAAIFPEVEPVAD